MIRNIKARIWGKRYDPVNKKLGKYEHDTMFAKYYIYGGTIYYGHRLLVFIYSMFNDIY